MNILVIVIAAAMNAVFFAIGSGNNTLAAICVFLLIPTSLFLYFAPTWVANKEKHPKTTAIFVLNLFLGWTVLGWVVALVWAHTSSDAHATTAAPADDRPSWDAPKPAAAVAAMSSDEATCPFCAEVVKAAAIKCKHCGSDLTPATS